MNGNFQANREYADPYYIEDKADFIAFAKIFALETRPYSYANKIFILMTDIDLSGQSYDYITRLLRFAARLEGNGHYIKGMLVPYNFFSLNECCMKNITFYDLRTEDNDTKPFHMCPQEIYSSTADQGVWNCVVFPSENIKNYEVAWKHGGSMQNTQRLSTTWFLPGTSNRISSGNPIRPDYLPIYARPVIFGNFEYTEPDQPTKYFAIHESATDNKPYGFYLKKDFEDYLIRRGIDKDQLLKKYYKLVKGSETAIPDITPALIKNSPSRVINQKYVYATGLQIQKTITTTETVSFDNPIDLARPELIANLL